MGIKYSIFVNSNYFASRLPLKIRSGASQVIEWVPFFELQQQESAQSNNLFITWSSLGVSCCDFTYLRDAPRLRSALGFAVLLCVAFHGEGTKLMFRAHRVWPLLLGFSGFCCGTHGTIYYITAGRQACKRTMIGRHSAHDLLFHGEKAKVSRAHHDGSTVSVFFRACCCISGTW